MPVPKKLHFIWAGGEKPMPDKNIQCLVDWKAKNKDFEVILWVDKSTTSKKVIEDYLSQDPPNGFKGTGVVLKDIHEQEVSSPHIDYEINRLWPNYGSSSDLLRYNILEKFGGVYFDSDVSPGEQPLNHDGFFDKAQGAVFLLNANSQNMGVIGNDAFICTPGHPLMRKLAIAAHENYGAPFYDEYQNEVYKPLDIDAKREKRMYDTIYRTGPKAVTQTFYQANSLEKQPQYTKQRNSAYEEHIMFSQVSKKYWMPAELVDTKEPNQNNWLKVPVTKYDTVEKAIEKAAYSIAFEARHMGYLSFDDHVKEIAESIRLHQTAITTHGDPSPQEEKIASLLCEALHKLQPDLSRVTKVQVLSRYKPFRAYCFENLPKCSDGTDYRDAKHYFDTISNGMSPVKKTEMAMHYLQNALVNHTEQCEEIQRQLAMPQSKRQHEEKVATLNRMKQSLGTLKEILNEARVLHEKHCDPSLRPMLQLRENLMLKAKDLKIIERNKKVVDAIDKFLEILHNDKDFLNQNPKLASKLLEPLINMIKKSDPTTWADIIRHETKSALQTIEEAKKDLTTQLLSMPSDYHYDRSFTKDFAVVNPMLLKDIEKLENDVKVMQKDLEKNQSNMHITLANYNKFQGKPSANPKWSRFEVDPIQDLIKTLLKCDKTFDQKQASNLTKEQIGNLLDIFKNESKTKINGQLCDLIKEGSLTVSDAKNLSIEHRELINDSLSNLDQVIKKAHEDTQAKERPIIISPVMPQSSDRLNNDPSNKL